MPIDRQTLIFFIVMFIFISLPTGNEQPQTNEEKNVLDTYHKELQYSQNELQRSNYSSGYGNVTGFHLSYEDLRQGLNATKWPFHEYNATNPWTEDEKWSLLPNIVSDRVKAFWGTESVGGKAESGSNLGVKTEGAGLVPGQSAREEQTDTTAMEIREDGSMEAIAQIGQVHERAYLLNISGRAYGEFEQINDTIEPFDLKVPGYLADYYSYRSSEKYKEDKERYENDPENNEPPQEIDYQESGYVREGNITGNGKIALSIKAQRYLTLPAENKKSKETKTIDNAVIVNLNFDLKDHDEIQGFSFDTQGVYFQDTGSLLTVTKSAKFFGQEVVPHFAMSESKFELAKTLFLNHLNSTHPFESSIDDMHNAIFDSYNKCEYIGYFQLEKTRFNKEQLRVIDTELANPEGVPLPSDIPEIVIKNYLLYSPDCGRIITNKKEASLSGLKTEISRKRIKNLLVGLLGIIGFQFYLFLKQINRVRTPGQLSIISAKTLYLLGLQDAVVALMFLIVSSTVEELYLIVTCVAAVVFVMCGIFEMRFMVSVLTTQVNERGTTWWEILRGGTRGEESEGAPGQNVQGGSPAGAPTGGPPVVPGTLPMTNPPTAPQNATPTTNVPEVWEESSFANTIFGVGFMITFVVTFIIANSLTWRVLYRKIFEYVGLLFINSFWVPQFLRHTLKNRKRSFTWTFIIGSSVLRVIPIYYFTLYKSNPLRHHYDPHLALVVTFWLGFQITLLYFQALLGPRFWVNEKWLPKAYNYQSVIEMKDLESRGFASDLLASIKPEEEHDGILECKTTCPICMTDLELPILVDGQNKEARKRINTNEYSITPCHHIFHEECLENWMKYKLQCPVCRDSLPPI